MDIFMEKIVKRRKNIKDQLLTAGVIFGTLVLMLIALNIQALAAMGFNMLIVVGLGYAAYLIISQRKRKRIFSANCKSFEIVAKVKSEHYTQQYKSFKNKIDCSGFIDGDDVYFVVLQYKNEQTILFFEPSEKMLQNFRTFIPRKVFTD
jgi:hypothetical protein